MPIFRYRAVDESGKTHEGTLEEASRFRVTTILRERGLDVGEVTQISEKTFIPRLRRSLTWEDICLFNDYLIATVRSCLPLAPSLKALSDDLRNSRLRRVLEEIRQSLERGTSLEDALTAHSSDFPPTYIASIRAGEQSGNLLGVLQELGSYSKRMSELKASVKESLAYPALVVCACLFVIIFFLAKVVPIYADIFKSFGGNLPWLTRFWIGISEAFVAHYALLVGLFGSAVILYIAIKQMARRSEELSYVTELIFPWLGLNQMRYYAMVAEFSRTLGTLLSSRVPIETSLDLAAAASRSAMLRKAVRRATSHVSKGISLADAMKSGGYFDPFYVWMIGVAEGRGELPSGALALADSYEDRLGNVARFFVRFLTPVVVAIAGLVVVSVVLSLYLPIYSLGDVISGN